MRPALAAALLLFAGVSAGCRKSQADVCRQLISCADALVPTAQENLREAYGPDGNCWKNGESAAVCTKGCTEALEGLKANPKFDATPACTGR